LLMKAQLKPDGLLAFEDEVHDVIHGSDDVPDVPADGIGDTAARITELVNRQVLDSPLAVLQEAGHEARILVWDRGAISESREVWHLHYLSDQNGAIGMIQWIEPAEKC
jgi:hypothetical protein